MAYQHGIDCVEKADALLKGKRVGLITNHTGLTVQLARSVDVIHHRYHLVKLYAPEHGLDGVVQNGKDVEEIIDRATGVPVYSLYGKNKSLNLDGVDVLAYDIQDIGVRFYTYISVLAIAMEECRKKGIPMIVFDRYNPLGLEKVRGTMLDERFTSYVGMFPIPSQYGMTPGEYARYINSETGIHCQLHVIPCQDLKRTDTFETLGLQWVNPSPNIPTFQSALIYTGTVLFEGTNLSEGRGTTKPFEFIGAPWVNAQALARVMNEKKLPGVWFRPISFMPVFSKHKEECCNGVQVHVTDSSQFESFYCGLVLLDTIRKLYPALETNNALTNLLGTDAFTKKDFKLEAFVEEHRQKLEEFSKKAEKYLLYP